MGRNSWFELVKVTNPGAGLSAKRKIPGETFERLHSLRFVLTTSAAVANRFPGVSFLDGDGNTILRVESNTAVTASHIATVNLFLNCGQAAFALSGEQFGPLPDLLLAPGYSVQVSTTNIDAADTHTGVTLYTCRYPSGEWTPSYGVMPYMEHEKEVTS